MKKWNDRRLVWDHRHSIVQDCHNEEGTDTKLWIYYSNSQFWSLALSGEQNKKIGPKWL